jgi:hypothetical protein
MTQPAANVQAERPRFEFRAQVVLAISIALLVLASMVIVVSESLDPLETGVRAIGVFLILAALLATWLGLGRGTAWATAVAVPILLLTILLSLAEVALGLPQGRFTIPVAAVAAWWALRAYRPAGARGESTSMRPALVVVACFIAGWAWGLVANQLLVDGGPLRAARNDLVAALSIDCGTTDEVPATASATVTWEWARGEPLSASIDHLAIAWRPEVGSRSSFGFERLDPHGDESITLGSHGGAGSAANDWVLSIGEGVTMTVDPASSLYAPRSVTVTLSRSEAVQLAAGSLDVQARYFHDERWDSGVIYQPGGACRW